MTDVRKSQLLFSELINGLSTNIKLNYNKQLEISKNISLPISDNLYKQVCILSTIVINDMLSKGTDIATYIDNKKVIVSKDVDIISSGITDIINTSLNKYVDMHIIDAGVLDTFLEEAILSYAEYFKIELKSVNMGKLDDDVEKLISLSDIIIEKCKYLGVTKDIIVNEEITEGYEKTQLDEYNKTNYNDCIGAVLKKFVKSGTGGVFLYGREITEYGVKCDSYTEDDLNNLKKYLLYLNYILIIQNWIVYIDSLCEVSHSMVIKFLNGSDRFMNTDTVDGILRDLNGDDADRLRIIGVFLKKKISDDEFINDYKEISKEILKTLKVVV